MKFVSVRELSLKPRHVWEELRENKEVIITSNGKPIALMSGVDEKNFEYSLESLRQAKALISMDNMQKRAVKYGLDKMSIDDIDKEIKAVRKERKT
jgi:antitoxin (DNA-binding transcriptional repressor) of toxin-antitoxin stability system